MRGIKFRAFDLDDKEMMEVSALDWSDGKIITLNYPNGKKYPNDEMGDRVRIMQYTGLKDKNGVEIYEGDIIKHKAQFNDEIDHNTWEIIYEDNKGAFMCKRINKKIYATSKAYCHDLCNRSNGVKIIGNIYENPNLINNK